MNCIKTYEAQRRGYNENKELKAVLSQMVALSPDMQRRHSPVGLTTSNLDTVGGLGCAPGRNWLANLWPLMGRQYTGTTKPEMVIWSSPAQKLAQQKN